MAKGKTVRRARRAGHDVMALALPDQRRLDDDIKALFATCEEKLGLVPNVLRAYTLRPEKLRRFGRFYNEVMLGESGLSKLEREMIAVVVSSVNRCFYCLVAHGAAVRELSGDAALGEMLVMNYCVAPLDRRQRAMLDFAWKLTEASHTIEEADRAALRAAGFSDADIWDIAEVAGFYNMSNRLASAVDMRPNAAYHAKGR
ncbi:MAG: peroxidase-related enzyme [Alphaproteobacteria bacterium]|nr:peroxidase-related enzyme [Alphaproteobacteria bacterium]